MDDLMARNAIHPVEEEPLDLPGSAVNGAVVQERPVRVTASGNLISDHMASSAVLPTQVIAADEDGNLAIVRPVAVVETLRTGGTTYSRRFTNETTHRTSNTSSRSSISSAKMLSLRQIANKAVSKNGMFSTIVYVVLATLLALSTYGLDSLANTPVNLGVVEQAWDHDIFDIPVNTFMQGATTMQAIQTTVLTQNLSYGTQSLSDLQYDTCGIKDWPCAEKVRPNTERVFSILATSFALIPEFDVPEIASSPEKLELKYVNTLSGYNFPVVQYRIPGSDVAVVCSVRRNRYRVAQEAEAKGEIDSVAICSKRAYDPNWICENEVAKDATSYIINIKQGRVTYLGHTLRGEMYYKPGNIARLTGSAQGTMLLSTVIGIDEYNGGIIQSSAPWDMAPAYLCQGTFNFDTYVGMRWRGQGVVAMTWKASALMVTNSFVLWSVTMSLAVIQTLYLANSSVSVIPVNMAKTIVGPVILGFACYGNYNVQVLTTYLNVTKVTSFDVTPYRLCGPAMFSSVIALMSGTAIQIFFNPFLVSPSYVLTFVSTANFLVVFVLEAFVFPKASVMLTRACGLPTSTTCSYYSATVKNYYLSPLIAACGVGIGILVVATVQRAAHKRDVPPTNSVLILFNTKTLRRLATSGAGGCIVASETGTPLLDAGILLNKNLVRVSSTCIVRSCIVKYVIVYRFLPPIVARVLSHAVGVSMVIKAREDRVLKEIAFLELKDMKLESHKSLPAYYT